MLRRCCIGFLLVVFVFMYACEVGFGADKKSTVTIEVLCAGAMRPPIDEMTKKYETKTGVKVQITYASASALLQQIKISPHGDIFIPADRYYTDQAVKDGLAENPKVFAYLVPVILVQKGNPKKITKLADFTRKDIRVGLVEKRVGAIGKLFANLLEKNKIQLNKINVVYNAPIIGDLANAVKLKAIDAAVVWKPTALTYRSATDYVDIPKKMNIVVPVSAGIIKTSTNKKAARDFMQFLTSKTGKSILEKHHYPTANPLAK